MIRTIEFADLIPFFQIIAGITVIHVFLRADGAPGRDESIIPEEKDDVIEKRDAFFGNQPFPIQPGYGIVLIKILHGGSFAI